MTIIRSRKLKLCRQMHDGRLLKIVTFGMVKSPRPRGRPPRRWVNDITDWWQMDLCSDRDGTGQKLMERVHDYPRWPTGNGIKKRKKKIA